MREIDTDELSHWIGKTETLEDLITLAPAKSMAAMLGHEHDLGSGDELPPL